MVATKINLIPGEEPIIDRVRRLILALAPVASLAATATVLADSLSFNTHLSGNQEVMPTGIVNKSLAQG